MRDQDFFQVYH